jgi:hypothetical protein
MNKPYTSQHNHATEQHKELVVAITYGDLFKTDDAEWEWAMIQIDNLRHDCQNVTR